MKKSLSNMKAHLFSTLEELAAVRPYFSFKAVRKSLEVFKQGFSLASVDGGRLRPAHLVVALVEQWDPVVSSAVTKLGHHPDEVLKVFRLSQSDSEPPFPTETAGTLYRERRRKPCRP